MAEVEYLGRKYHKNSTSHSLVIEQPQPLLDNDYILPKAILKYIMLVSHCHSTNFLESFVTLKI